MINSTYPSPTSALKRSTSTPGTLFSLKSLSIDNESDFREAGYVQSSGGKTATAAFKLYNKITPEELAKQLTLIDWSIFSRISRNELKPGQWTGTTKQHTSPNIVEFTRRFNNLTFWVTDEILASKLSKQRADIISYFIKVIAFLIELNNLHSSYAIKSALSSASIHRLEKTWACLSKKDRQSFEKICDLFSETDNNSKLRNFMDSALKTSRNHTCIPNLATFLRDIIHIDCAYPSNSEHLAGSRNEKFESIFSFIEKCQQSNYEFIDLNESVYDYLNSFTYIEELQKFREDSYYKISYKLEPLDNTNLNSKNKLSNSNKFNSQYDISALRPLEFYTNNCYNSNIELANCNKNAKNILNKSMNDEVFQETKKQTNFKPTHRKTNSLEIGSGLLAANKNNLFNKSVKNIRLNLIDDSPAYDICPLGYGNRCDRKQPSLEMLKSNGTFAIDHCEYNDDNINSLDDSNGPSRCKFINFNNDLIYKCYINRKTILKSGKKPSITFWANYYLAMTNDSLLFFNTKSYCQAKGFNSKPVKSLPLMFWSLVYDHDPDKSNKANIFTIADKSGSNVYKIRTNTELEAKELVKLIDDVIYKLSNAYMI